MKISTLFLNSLNILNTDAQKRPNVILLLADDLGMGDISLNNKDGKIKTPNIGNHIFRIYSNNDLFYQIQETIIQLFITKQ